jgi:hypothetical protein
MPPSGIAWPFRHRVLASVKGFLEKRLKLRVNMEKSAVEVAALSEALFGRSQAIDRWGNTEYYNLLLTS